MGPVMAAQTFYNKTEAYDALIMLLPQPLKMRVQNWLGCPC